MNSTASSGGYCLAAVAIAVVGVAAICLGAYISYEYGLLLGSEAIAFGGILVFAFKALLPFAISASARSKHYILTAFSVVAIGFCCAFSLSTAWSYGKAIRGVGATLSENRTNLQEKLQGLPDTRPIPVLTQKLKSVRRKKDREPLETELGYAAERERIETELAEMPVSAAVTAGGIPEWQRTGMAVVLAGCLELAELLCLFAAAVLWGAPVHKTRKNAHVPKTCTPDAHISTDQNVVPLRKASGAEAWLQDYAQGRDRVSVREAWASYSRQAIKGPRKTQRAFEVLAKRVFKRLGLEEQTIAGRKMHVAA